MKKIYSIILMAGVLFSAIACSHDAAEQEIAQEGAISLSLGVQDDVVTRATTDEILQDAVIKIYKPAYEGLARQYTYSTLPAQIFLPATTGTDKYRVDVTAGERVKENPVIASFDSKSYKGTAEFTVAAGVASTTPVEVIASVCNAVTQPSFDATLAEAFGTNYTLTVALGEDNLVYDSAKSGKDGFFIIADDAFEPEMTWAFAGTLLKDGSSFTKDGKFTVEQGKRYKMAFKYTEKDGTLTLTLSVDKTVTEVEDEIIFEPTSTGISTTKRYETWATHTTLHADVDESEYDATKVYFEYRKYTDGGTEAWTRLGAATRVSEGVFSSVLSGLTPSTVYEYRLVVSALADNTETIVEGTKTITTDVAPNVPNGGFEDISNDESSKYPSFWNPASSIVENQTAWWGSGNAGSGDFGYIIATTDTSDYKEGTQSARLQSAFAVVKFAAGNLFSGKFGQVIGTSGGTVYFGRPFVGRPTKLRFWAKYSTGKVTTAGGPDGGKLTTDDYDSGRVQVALGTWTPAKYGGTSESPVLINTTNTSTFVDFNTDAATIAYGDKMFNYTETEWQEVVIDLKYADLKTMPTHIIISCASSYLGDYFAGCKDSKLWIDDMELIYDEDVTVK